MDRRAATLEGYYRRVLAKYDSRLHNTEPGEIGPLVSLFESFGKLETLVVGPWGNGSKDLHNLVRTLGELSVASRERGRGQEAATGSLAQSWDR